MNLDRRGFTLLEMLVVLVIFALVSLLLFTLLSQVLQIRARLTDQLAAIRQEAVKETWFRESTRAVLADYTPTPNPYFFQSRPPQVFYGKADEFGGLTLMPLDESAGQPMSFAWLLRREQGWTLLLYRTASQQEWEVLRWPGHVGLFQYLDKDKNWHDQWPPPVSAAEKNNIFSQVKPPPQLPEAIVLHGSKQHQPFTWLVAIPGDKENPWDPRMFGDEHLF